jgi:hypothetical protein
MWNIQQQEQWDYEAGWATEQQNALAWSRMNRRPDGAGRIAELVAAGKFVAVVEATEYCPSTDAIMGSRKDIDSVHDTREAAEAAVSKIYESDYPDDWSAYVLPRVSHAEPAAARADVAPGDDELPF